MNPYFIWWGRY